MPEVWQECEAGELEPAAALALPADGNPTNQPDVQNCLPSHVFLLLFLMLMLKLRAGALL